jgi:hypothetical protein
MRRSYVVLSSLALSIAASFVASREARAEEPSPSVSEAPAPDTQPQQAERLPELRPIALTANPLSLLLGRVGLNVEYLPARHHGIMLNPYFDQDLVHHVRRRARVPLLHG